MRATRTTSVVAVHLLVWVVAVVEAWWMPRGPTSTSQSLVALGIALGTGVVAGRLLGSRWVVLTLPLTYLVVFEIVRLGVDGPTVDGLALSTYGVIALVTGRLFHALVVLLPLAWGAALGVLWSRRADGDQQEARPGTRRGRWSRRTAWVATGAVLVAFAALLARPASTAPITGPDGTTLAGSIAELGEVEVDGHTLGLMIRGHDRTAPVLLFLAGGPGGSELGAMRRHLPGLEEHFVVVTWDQRGTGRSYGELDPSDTLTLESSVRDTLQVTDHLRDRFDQERIYLVGQSWGSTLAVLAAQAAPEKYAALVGVGQMVSQLATDRIFYADTVEWAARTGRDDLSDELDRIGPPPYTDVRDYETVLSHEMEMYPYDHGPNSEGQGQMSENILVREYSLTEQVRLLSGTLDTFATLYPQLQDVDFRRSATELDLPVFFVEGAHEAPGRAVLLEEWYPRLEAPLKDRTTLTTSGHRPLFEQPDEFIDYLTDVVVPRASELPRR